MEWNDYETLDKAIDYIDSKIAVSVDGVSKYVGLSIKQLDRKFRAIRNSSVAKYIDLKIHLYFIAIKPPAIMGIFL